MADRKKVAVVMGSDSDLPVVGKAIDKLKAFGIPVEAHVMSAHRTPEEAASFASSAEEKGFGVIIAAAGEGRPSGRRAGGPHGAAGYRHSGEILHPGRAGFPVVHGPNALGIPVATVAVDGAENAAILARRCWPCPTAALTQRFTR